MRGSSQAARVGRVLIALLAGVGVYAAIAPAAGADEGHSAGTIAFASYRADLVHSQIWLMRADGSGQTQLTSDPSNNGEPEWSTNHRKIAFLTDRDGDQQIYL